MFPLLFFYTVTSFIPLLHGPLAPTLMTENRIFPNRLWRRKTSLATAGSLRLRQRSSRKTSALLFMHVAARTADAILRRERERELRITFVFTKTLVLCCHFSFYFALLLEHILFVLHKAARQILVETNFYETYFYLVEFPCPTASLLEACVKQTCLFQQRL